MSPQRIEELALIVHDRYMADQTNVQVQHASSDAIRTAVREALDEAERRCEAMQPGEWVGSDNVIRRLRDELTG